jgi:hypothetical protein
MISYSFGQSPDPLDFGKMWTFENPPKKYLKDTYGLASSDVRAAATAIKKANIDELDEKTKRIQELVDICL